mgnify:CR=1 FL=1
MANFYEAFEKNRSTDIKHYGVRGMRWGVRTQFYTDPQTNRRMMRHDFAMAKDPKGANKKAVELSRKALERFGETDPQKILDLDFSTFMNRTFESLLSETPENQRNGDTILNAYKRARDSCAVVYMSAMIANEANKRLAGKGK